MIARLVGILGALVLAGWLYWLTARVQFLLTHVESTLDRADQALAAAMAVVAAAPPTPAPSGDMAQGPVAGPPVPVPPTGPSPAGGPPTVPSGMALELEKQALVERAFPVHGAPRRFTFKASDDGTA
ncbi:hypothetical protein [Blastococcus haudaquaticus]|uniref:Uncharacterized protein n=1 Tax=Blastococcus haudaquaticus TaxID=1938745 RepID=A0A286H0I0_9ACTN|nr:hypothetical protein [Blastococcus haudaquaticus]SOE01267.1 hypothetical protein SAMN06272739_3059 [Blastococcus haudaquaticus]